MLIAVVVCILGIVVENYRFPEDRSRMRDRFVQSTDAGERMTLLAGLVLGHSVVRWLISFAVAATLVRVALEAPGARDMIHRAVESGSISLLGIDAVLGAAIAAIMALLSIAARFVSR